MLKINIQAANNVIDESNFYNSKQNDQKSCDKQDKTPHISNNDNIAYQADSQTNNLVIINGENGKSESNEVIGSNFFSFKDYEKKIGKSRGAQTCLKIENRALAIPTTMIANPEMNLDSKSLSHSSKKN